VRGGSIALVMITVYLALYGPKGSVISDHPYNPAGYARPSAIQ